MPRDVYREALDLASNIRDRYLRAVTYAKIGYYFYRLKNPMYKEAFKRSFNAVETIENPPLIVRALIELGTYLAKTRVSSASKVFQQADEILSKFRWQQIRHTFAVVRKASKHRQLPRKQSWEG